MNFRNTDWGRCLFLVGLILLGAVSLVAVGSPAGAQDEYVIGVDDLLHISVWDNKDLDQVVPVRPDGKISFPLAGEVEASGVTVPELKRILTERLSKSVKSPDVSVVVQEIRSFKVYLMGRVAKSGVYPVKAGIPLLQALTLAGGVTDGADLGAAYIVRGTERIPVNLRRLIQEGDLQQNLQLRTGDTVVVPEIVAGANPQELAERRIYVLGKVQKPGVYTIRQDLPILHALFLAGGLADGGDQTAAFVIRGDKRLPVNLRRLIQKGDLSQNVMVQHEDTIVVPEGGDIQNSVFIMGEVVKPGAYPRAEALTLMKLVSIAGGFTKFAAPGRITVIREKGASLDDKRVGQDGDGKVEAEGKTRLSVDVNAMQKDPKNNPDVALLPGDVVVVPQTLF